METVIVIEGNGFDAESIGKTIYMIQPVGSIAKAQLENKSTNANKSDYAIDGVFDAGEDASAADILGIRINDVGWSKIAVPAGSAPVMISMK